MSMDNRCVVCSAIIPEGRYVCPNCEKGYINKQIGTAYTLESDGEWHSEPMILSNDRFDNE